MSIEFIVRIEGREVASIEQEVPTTEALDLEQQTEQLKDRLEQVVLEVRFDRMASSLRWPCCCGRAMQNKGRRCVAIASLSGPVVLQRNRFRCVTCGAWQTPVDAVVCCGRHRMTRYLARQVCQLATLEHDPRMKLVHDVGRVAEARRLAEVQQWRSPPSQKRRWPEPEVTPRRVYVSCDRILYCTNQSEPDLQQTGTARLIWKQMRVGCVSWQAPDDETWYKQVVWGRKKRTTCPWEPPGLDWLAAADFAKPKKRFLRPMAARGAGAFTSNTSPMRRAFSTGITPVNMSGSVARPCTTSPRSSRPGSKRP